jgi:hypothetical protein
MYSPSLKVWTTPEPYGAAYVDGPDLYEAFKDNPLKYVDPKGTSSQDVLNGGVRPSDFGNIVLFRAGHARAQVTASCGATVEAIAKRANMDATLYKAWLKSEDGEPLPTTQKQIFGHPRKFSVPNTVFIGVGNIKRSTHWFLGQVPPTIYETLTNKHFKIEFRDFMAAGPWASSDVTALKSDLYGLVYFGEGASDGTLDVAHSRFFFGLFGDHDYLDPSSFAPGRFGLLIIEACHAGHDGKWMNTASDTAKANGSIWVSPDKYQAMGNTPDLNAVAQNAR